MHTTVCTFHDRETAERARDELVRAGFKRRDVHIEHHGAAQGDGDDEGGRHAGEDPRGWSGTDHEIAVDRDMVDRVAGFFVHLFGAGHEAGLDRQYGDAVESGQCVLVVDADDAAEAQRAQTLLHGIEAQDVNVVHRPEQRPLRDIVGAQEEGGWAGSYADRASAWDQPVAMAANTDATPASRDRTTGEWAEREDHAAAAQAVGEARVGSASTEGDRAVAGADAPVDRAVAPSAGRDWQAGAANDARPRPQGEGVDPVGLRYTDKDKPAND